jgi:hypothetical protein
MSFPICSIYLAQIQAVVTPPYYIQSNGMLNVKWYLKDNLY